MHFKEFDSKNYLQYLEDEKNKLNDEKKIIIINFIEIFINDLAEKNFAFRNLTKLFLEIESFEETLSQSLLNLMKKEESYNEKPNKLVIQIKDFVNIENETYITFSYRGRKQEMKLIKEGHFYLTKDFQ